MRHAIRAAIRPTLTILLIVCALSCGPRSVKTEFSPVLVDDQGRLSLGGFEHRGQRYELWDLMDAGYRAGHDDAFVREFAINNTLLGGFVRVVSSDAANISTSFLLDSSDPQFYEDDATQQCVEILSAD